MCPIYGRTTTIRASVSKKEANKLLNIGKWWQKKIGSRDPIDAKEPPKRDQSHPTSIQDSLKGPSKRSNGTQRAPMKVPKQDPNEPQAGPKRDPKKRAKMGDQFSWKWHPTSIQDTLKGPSESSNGTQRAAMKVPKQDPNEPQAGPKRDSEKGAKMGDEFSRKWCSGCSHSTFSETCLDKEREAR